MLSIINAKIVANLIYLLNSYFSYYPPLAPGYGTEAIEKSLEDYEYPNGRVWKPLIETGRYIDPSLKCKKYCFALKEW